MLVHPRNYVPNDCSITGHSIAPINGMVTIDHFSTTSFTLLAFRDYNVVKQKLNKPNYGSLKSQAIGQ